MALTNFEKNRILNHEFNRTALPAMAPTYLGLLTSLPTVSGGGAEVPVGDSYDRVVVTGKFAAAANGEITSNAALAWPTPTGDGWSDVVGIAQYDSATPGTGNMIRFSPLQSPKTVAAGDPPSIASGSATFRI